MSPKGLRWALLVTAVAVVAVHATGLHGGFVYDDHRFIEHNEALRGLPLVRAFSDPSTASHGEGIQHDIYRPLRTLLFSLEFHLFARGGVDGAEDYHLPLWHLVSALLHALNSLLVLRLLLVLLRGALIPATAGALLFGLHPVTCESVAWLSSQGDLLAMTLLLLGLLAMERPGPRRTAAGLALFLLACLAKESALMLPLLLPLRDLALPRGDGAVPTPWARTTWVRAGGLAAVAAGYFVVRLLVLPGLAQVEHPGGTVWNTVRAMLHGLAWYGRALLWPVGFTFDTRLDVPLRWSDPEVVAGLGVLATLLLAGLHGLRRRPLLAFAALGFLVCLGPVSNVVVPLKTFVADRFLYPGLLCVAAAAAAGLRAARGTARHALLTVGAAALVVLGILTVGRNAAWADERSLWEAVRADRPWNANAYQGIAFDYLREHRVTDAENAFATYLQANPLDGKAMAAMGGLFGQLADGLVAEGPALGGETNIELRHRQARVAQIRLYQRAFEVWSQPGGLALGRGSPAMLRALLDSWIDAATDLGDLASARFANDQAIDLEAGGRALHEDPDAVWREASWLRRRTRIDLALRAVRAAHERPVPKGLEAQVAAVRADVLRDVGLDPQRSDAAQRRPLAERLRALVAEAERTPGLESDPIAFADLALLLDAEGERPQALEAVRRGLAHHPGHPFLRAIEGRLQGPVRRPR